MKQLITVALALTLTLALHAQSDHQHQDMEQTVPAMASRHMEMGAHMEMTSLRPSRTGDQQRAEQILAAARKLMQQYQDYHAALGDGYRIFLPNVPQRMYHFTNYLYGFRAAFEFDPEHPTSLLYERHGHGYRLIGVMYTAPQTATDEELDLRVPLSVARWHKHVNLCLPDGQRRGMAGAHPQFGLRGSISTRAQCEQAGGTFLPQVFGWMVHVYPDEKGSDAIWSVDRQMHAAHGH